MSDFCGIDSPGIAALDPGLMASTPPACKYVQLPRLRIRVTIFMASFAFQIFRQTLANPAPSKVLKIGFLDRRVKDFWSRISLLLQITGFSAENAYSIATFWVDICHVIGQTSRLSKTRKSS